MNAMVCLGARLKRGKIEHLEMNEKLLRRNVRLYGWFKVFNKRVFLPLTAIYLVDVGHVSLGQIGIIAVATALMTLIMQLPSGYFADRYTRRLAMMIGSATLALGVGVLVLSPSFITGLISGIVTGFGFAFISGAGQALMHDSLEHSGQANQYVKTMGRAQSKGLIGNVVLVGLVPMTYAIDERMPFILGVVAFLVLFWISWAFVEPKREGKPDGNSHFREIVVATRTFIDRRTIVLFVAIGLVFGLYSAPLDYTNLVLKDLGLAPQYLGWAFAASSLLGAIGGYVMHRLQALSFRGYMCLDIIICCGFFVAVGLTRSLVVGVIAFLINLSFYRLRGIFYQHYLFEMFAGSRHKATLVSLMGFGEQLFSIVLPLLFAVAIAHGGFYHGYAAIGLGMTLVLGAITVLGFARLRRVQLEA